MKDELVTTEVTKAGLKIYYAFDKDSQKQHIKTVKCRYEPIINDLNWVRDYKKILPTAEERMHLEMKYQIYSIDWSDPDCSNLVQRNFVNKMDVVCVKEILMRDGSKYYTILMSDMKTEVRVSKTVYTLACKLGVQVQSIKRLA